MEGVTKRMLEQVVTDFYTQHNYERPSLIGEIPYLSAHYYHKILYTGKEFILFIYYQLCAHETWTTNST